MSKVLIGMDHSGSFRVYLTVTTDLVEEARTIHNTTPLATAGLGRVLTGAGMMGLLLKNKSDKLTLLFKGDGPAKQILATATGAGEVKGYIANPDVELPLTEAGKLDVGGSLGIGELTVIKDLGLKEPYVGTIALVSGEIAEDLTAYYFISEQQNTAISLAEACGGENTPQETVLERMLQEIFADMPEEYRVRTLESRDLRWHCDCSEERLEKILMTIGEKDLTEIIEEDEGAELVCQFCCKKYYFDKEHLQRILAEMKKKKDDIAD